MARGRQLHDRYFKQAKAEGYLARSAYKLEEINEKKRVLRRGWRVLDLGCCPGAWMQVAERVVGPKGVVLGVDLNEVSHGFADNVRAIVGDAFEADPAALMEAAAEIDGSEARRFDVVLSDMAPKTAGDRGDHFKSVHLCERALELCRRLLKPGGHVVMKVFEGEAYPELLKDAGRQFEHAKGFKPKASRDSSREIYIVGHRMKASAALGADLEGDEADPG